MSVRALSLALLLAPAPLLAQEPAFDHLRVDGHVVETTHGLPLALSIDGTLALLGETRFAESYDGPTFLVSAAAWSDAGRLVAVHAETLADGAGGLDYSDLRADSLAGRPFTSRIDCFDLREETAEDIESNGFLRFLAGAGFDFDTSVALKRYYATNPEGTAEVVVSYGVRLEACGPDGAAPPEIVRRIERDSRSAVRPAGPEE